MFRDCESDPVFRREKYLNHNITPNMNYTMQENLKKTDFGYVPGIFSPKGRIRFHIPKRHETCFYQLLKCPQ